MLSVLFSKNFLPVEIDDEALFRRVLDGVSSWDLSFFNALLDAKPKPNRLLPLKMIHRNETFELFSPRRIVEGA